MVGEDRVPEAEETSNLPNFWIRAFYGFNPEEAGYIGWTQQGRRDRVLAEAAPGDIFMVYGADTTETASQDRRQILGLLQIDPIAVTDVERSSDAAIRNKIENGWQKKWTFGVPVRRAWRALRRIEMKHLITETWTSSEARNVGQGVRITDAETQAILQIPVTEVPVFGEGPLPADVLVDTPAAEIFSPTRGVPAASGDVTQNREDGAQKLYFAVFGGDVPALLGRPAGAIGRKALIKVGYSNDVVRRKKELNSGFPPAATACWEMRLTSAEYSSGEEALEAENTLKSALAARFESLGGEFFLADLTSAESCFYAVPGVARVSIRA